MAMRLALAAFALSLVGAVEPTAAAGWNPTSSPMYAAFNRGHTLTALWKRLDDR